LDSIRKIPNVTILNVSKWLNQVLIKTSDANALTTINAISFVKKSNPIAPRISTTTTGPNPNDKFDEELKTQPITGTPNGRLTGITGGDLNYGGTYNQIHMHVGEYLHSQGFTGRGM